MSGTANIRVAFETEKTLSFGSVGVGFTLIGSNFQHNIRLLVIQNLTDAILTFSFDGVNNTITLPSMGQVIFDWASDKSNIAADLMMAIGRGVWVKQSGVPTSGAVYVSAFYAAGANAN